MPQTLGNMTSRAVKLARTHDEPYMVCEMDHQDTRVLRVHPLSYADEGEFEAFGGRIYAVAHPDGWVE